MTKGLRCPRCDTTIHRKTVHDWLVNKKSSHLKCMNAFCNTRWSRIVLEANAAQFIGETEKAEEPTPKPKTPVEAPAFKAMSAADIHAIAKLKSAVRVKRPAMRADQSWLDRIRIIARQFAALNGSVSIDDLRVWADENYMNPRGSNACWGSIFQGSQWSKVSQKRSTYAKSRSRKISVWVLKAAAKVAV